MNTIKNGEELSELETLLAKLVSFKSVTSDKEENKRLLDWVSDEIHPFFHIERFESNGHHSLIATTRKTKTPKVFLAAHVDVVPASDEMFTMRTVGDTLVGRGVMDMKFALACYFQLIKELGEKIKEYDIGLMLVSDEESGGFHGTKMLVQEGYGADIMLLPDGGYHWNVDAQAKGVIWLHVTVEGKPAHSSRPWEGVDPFEPLFVFLQDLKKQFVQEPCGDPTHRHHTMAIGKIAGGAVANQMAPSAEALVDIRFLPTVDKTEIESLVVEVAKRHKKVDVCVTEIAQAFAANLSHAGIKRWRSLVEVHGMTPKEMLAHGSSDARLFNGTSTTVMVTAPECGGFHSDEEWMNRKSLGTFYEVMKRWVTEVGEV